MHDALIYEYLEYFKYKTIDTLHLQIKNITK